MIGNLLGPAELEPAVRERIADAAAAYPLFVEEIVRHLTETGALVRDGDRWVAASDLSDLATPPSITALLSARLDRLEPAERDVVERASVIGRDFLGAEVEAISPAGSTGGVQRLLASAVTKDLIRGRHTTGDDAYSFPHMLLRDVAYDGIRKSTRADLHARYASWLEERGGLRIDPYEEIVAYHLEQAYRYRAELGPIGEAEERLAIRAGTMPRRPGGERSLAAISCQRQTPRKGGDVAAPDDPDRLAMLPTWPTACSRPETGPRRVGLRRAAREGAPDPDPALEARARMDRYTWQLVTDPGLRRGSVSGGSSRMRSTSSSARTAPNISRRVWRRWASCTSSSPGTSPRCSSRRAGTPARRRGSPAAATSADIIAQALVVGSTPCDVALARLETLLGDFADEPMVRAAIGLRAALVLAMLERFSGTRASKRAPPRRCSRSVAVALVGRGGRVTGLIEWWDGDVYAAERSIRTGAPIVRRSGEADAALVAGRPGADLVLDSSAATPRHTDGPEHRQETLPHSRWNRRSGGIVRWRRRRRSGGSPARQGAFPRARPSASRRRDFLSARATRSWTWRTCCCPTSG